MFLHICFVSRIWHHISSPGSLCLWWTAFPSALSVGLTTPEGVLPYISYTGMCKQYKDDRDEDSLLDLYEVEIVNWRGTRRILTSAAVYEGLLWNRPCKGQTIHARDLKPLVTRVVIFPLSRVLLDGLRKKEGCS